MKDPSWEKEFDEKFHKRIWAIVKLADPSSYLIAETYGMLEGDGPQIYGEIKDFIRSLLATEKKAWLEEMKDYNDRLYKGDGHFLTRAFLDVFEEHLKIKEKGR